MGKKRGVLCPDFFFPYKEEGDGGVDFSFGVREGGV